MQSILALLAFYFRPRTNKHKPIFPTCKTDENFRSGIKEKTFWRFFHAGALINGKLVKVYRLHWVAGSAIAMIFLWLGLVGGMPAQNLEVAQAIPGQPEKPLSSSSYFLMEFDPSGKYQAALTTHDLSQILEEAMTYTQLLQKYDDKKISGKIKSLKYKNLALAATLISATSEAGQEQRKWSEMAIEFGRIAWEASNKAPDLPNEENGESLDELNTRRLIAMALNYYQGGLVEMKDLISQYQVIDKNFLVRKGFCRYKILRAMEQDGIIQLPVFSTGKYI
jgi:hypothetical protein